MKKFVLALMTAVSCLAALTPTANAVENRTVRFTYIDPYFGSEETALPDISQYSICYETHSFVDQVCSALIYLPEEIVAQYDGYKVTKMFIVSPEDNGASAGQKVNRFTRATLVFREEMDGRSIQMQNIEFGPECRIWNEFVLDEPFEISADQPFYCGFTGILTHTNSCPFIYCGFPTEEPDGRSCLVEMGIMGWKDYSNYAGKLTSNGPLMIMIEMQSGEGSESIDICGPDGLIEKIGNEETKVSVLSTVPVDNTPIEKFATDEESIVINTNNDKAVAKMSFVINQKNEENPEELTEILKATTTERTAFGSICWKNTGEDMIFERGGHYVISYELYSASDVVIGSGNIEFTGNYFDGINSISIDATTYPIFNLQGIQVKGENLPDGLYIVNGKKVVIKK